MSKDVLAKKSHGGQHRCYDHMFGQRYGKLVAVSVVRGYVLPGTKTRIRTKIECKCDCGVTSFVPPSNLKTGHTSSCGCIQTTHGMRHTKTYKSWAAMKDRCTNPNASFYRNYGGRGIVVCARWLESFENFLEDMKEKPTPIHTIERVDVNGNYEPSNCIWIPKSEQNKNRRPMKHNRPTIPCPVCNTLFERPTKKTKNCSKECSYESLRFENPLRFADCAFCNKSFFRNALTNVCCSKPCAAGLKMRNNPPNMLTKTCPSCKKTYQTKRAAQKACSILCSNRDKPRQQREAKEE